MGAGTLPSEFYYREYREVMGQPLEDIPNSGTHSIEDRAIEGASRVPMAVEARPSSFRLTSGASASFARLVGLPEFSGAVRSEKSLRDLKLAQVTVDKNLIDALRALDRGVVEVAFVMSHDERLIGVLTDGDIRRALLGGATLDTPLRPYATTTFTSVSPEVSRTEVLELMHARHISVIPILDDQRRLLGLHRLRDMLGVVERPNWAVIMAGGKGTRLRPLTETIPKPMISVAGRPILERIVLHLVGHGIRRIFLAINYLGHMVERHFGNGSNFGCEIEYLREEEPLDTGGALSLLADAPKAPFLVMNGDLITQANIGKMLDFHQRGGQNVTVGVRKYFHTVPFGCVSIDDGRITSIEEKPCMTRITNTGIYVLNPRVLGHIKKGLSASMPWLIERCISSHETVAPYEIEDEWIDVGEHQTLHRARAGTSE